MGSLADEIRSAADSATEGAMSRMEEGRQERWNEERAGSEELRSALESAVPDEPRRKQAPATEESLGDTLNTAYNNSFIDAKRAESEQKSFAEFRELDRDVRRTHGTGATEATRKLLQSEAALRSNPSAALTWLAQAYGTPELAGKRNADIEARETQATAYATEQFFSNYDIPDGMEGAIIESLGKIERTGDHARDLLAAYQHATRGSEAVTMTQNAPRMGRR